MYLDSDVEKLTSEVIPFNWTLKFLFWVRGYGSNSYPDCWALLCHWVFRMKRAFFSCQVLGLCLWSRVRIFFFHRVIQEVRLSYMVFFFDSASTFLLTSFPRHVRDYVPNVSFFGSILIFVFGSRPWKMLCRLCKWVGKWLYEEETALIKILLAKVISSNYCPISEWKYMSVGWWEELVRMPLEKKIAMLHVHLSFFRKI